MAEPARRALLWASQNAFLRRRLPRLPFVRRAVLKFMPGETLDSALEAAQRFAERGLATTFTYLGENVVLFRDPADAAKALENRCPHRFAPLSLRL